MQNTPRATPAVRDSVRRCVLADVADVAGVLVVPLRPGQTRPVIEVHEGLSSASRRMRYSAPTPRLTARAVRVLTDLRPGQHEAYAAWRGGRPFGIARWIRTAELPDAAELAIEVVDAEQGHGIGRALVAVTLARAHQAGIRTIVVSVDPDNVRVRRWLTERRARALLDDADRFALPVRQGLVGPTSWGRAGAWSDGTASEGRSRIARSRPRSVFG